MTKELYKLLLSTYLTRQTKTSCFPACLDTLTVTEGASEKNYLGCTQFSLNKVQWRNDCWWPLSLSFWENVWLHWHQEKKSHKPSVLRAVWVKLSEWNSRQPLQNKLPRCSVYKRFGGWKPFCYSAHHLSVMGSGVCGGWWSAGVICCRSTGSEHHHTAQGSFQSRHLSQGRTSFLPHLRSSFP